MALVSNCIDGIFFEDIFVERVLFASIDGVCTQSTHKKRHEAVGEQVESGPLDDGRKRDLGECISNKRAIQVGQVGWGIDQCVSFGKGL